MAYGATNLQDLFGRILSASCGVVLFYTTKFLACKTLPRCADHFYALFNLHSIFFPGMRIFEGSLSMSYTKRRIEGGPRCFFSMFVRVRSSFSIIPKEFPIVGSNMIYAKDKPEHKIVAFFMESSCCTAFSRLKPCVHLRMNNHVF